MSLYKNPEARRAKAARVAERKFLFAWLEVESFKVRREYERLRKAHSVLDALRLVLPERALNYLRSH